MKENAGSDDNILVARAMKGNRDALDALIRKHQARAYQYAFRLTRDADEAADVVAESFVRVYRSMDKFKGDSAFTTWLYRILTNCFLDIRKKQKTRQTTSLDALVNTSDGGVEWQAPSTDRSPHQLAESEARLTRVTEALEQIPEYQSALIILFHSENLSYEEIAATLDIPIGTVKSRLNRARTSIHQQLHSEAELFQVA